MKNRFLSVVLLLYIILPVRAKLIEGRVLCDKKGIQNVVVSDGYSFTTTDKDGFYRIDASDKAHFIYIATPSGYMAKCNQGTPLFYKALNENNHDFIIYNYGIPNGRYVMAAVADTQPRGEQAFDRLENEGFKDLKETAKQYTNDNVPFFGVFLGDILWDNLDMYARMKQLIQQLNIPIYPVIGNHDHDQFVSDDDASAHLYRAAFGPTYYAFNAGNDYYLVLDDIIYKGNRMYDVGFTDEQLNWVKEYLNFVPKGAHLFVCMHAPAHFYDPNYKIEKIAELLDLFKEFNVDILSGHTHAQCNYQIRKNVREYNIASIGGECWLWDSTYNKDGCPIGYQVFESSKQGVKNYFKSLGYGSNFQMKTYPLGTVSNHENDICVKVWNWDNRWKVEWYEDDVFKGEMKQFNSFDPDYFLYCKKKQILEHTGKRAYLDEVYYFFSATPSDKAKKIRIVAIDASGKKYEAVRYLQ